MDVDPADAPAREAGVINQRHHLSVLSHAGSAKGAKVREHLGPRGDGAEGDFSEDEGVDHDLVRFEKLLEAWVAAAPVVDPDGRVREDDHAPRLLPGLRRGVAARLGMEPPRAASRRAASRVMRASSPARTRAVFSWMPDSSRARSSRPSSRISVVLICI